MKNFNLKLNASSNGVSVHVMLEPLETHTPLLGSAVRMIMSELIVKKGVIAFGLHCLPTKFQRYHQNF